MTALAAIALAIYLVGTVLDNRSTVAAHRYEARHGRSLVDGKGIEEKNLLARFAIRTGGINAIWWKDLAIGAALGGAAFGPTGAVSVVATLALAASGIMQGLVARKNRSTLEARIRMEARDV